MKFGGDYYNTGLTPSVTPSADFCLLLTPSVDRFDRKKKHSGSPPRPPKPKTPDKYTAMPDTRGGSVLTDDKSAALVWQSRKLIKGARDGGYVEVSWSVDGYDCGKRRLEVELD